MSIFDEVKKMAAGMAEQVLREKTGMNLDLDGSDQAVVEAPVEEEAVEEEATVEEEVVEEEVTEEVASEAPAAAPSGDLVQQVIGMAKNAGMGMVEQKLNMDLDGDGTVGQ